MGCNCRKAPRPFGPSTAKASKEPSEPSKFVLRTRLGQTAYGSRLEAEAAKRRAGGGTIIEVR